ncbi:MAG: protein BatD [Bacteroidales bacterium]|nr:protein BatD [Bacteroidales bacterium]
MNNQLKLLVPVMRFVLLTMCLSVAQSVLLSAQEVQFTAVAEPNVLRVGEQFAVTYESTQKISDITLPEFSDFQFLGGPSMGQSTQIESSPGRTYTKTTYSYTYYFRAVKEGKYNIAPASAQLKNKQVQSNALTIEVVGSNAPGSSSSGQPDQAEAKSSETSSDDVYVRLILNKNVAYIGEQIVATVKLYTKLQISGIDQRYKGPDFKGFYTEAIEIPPLRNLERENVNGDIYYTGILQKVLLIPQKAGELIIEPFDLDVSVRQQVKRRSNSFFDEFFEPSVRDIPVKLKSNRVAVKSRALPANKPDSYNGAVGDFIISTSVDKNKVKTNDAVNYKVIIKGRGNYKIVDEPQVNFPPDIEKYDPVIKTIAESPMSGIKTFEYLLIPHYPGEFIIPPVTFSYFDIHSKQFKTLTSGSHTISVEKGEGDTLMPIISGIAKEDVKLLRSDIQYIRLKMKYRAFSGIFLVDNIVYYLLFVLLILMGSLLLLLRRNHIKRAQDLAMVRNRKANRYARKRLKKAALLIKSDNKKGFYDELLGAIWLYLSDKLSIPIADLSGDSARSALTDRKIEEETMNRLFEVINDCEFARYAPSSETVDEEQLLDKAVKLIVRLQQELG